MAVNRFQDTLQVAKKSLQDLGKVCQKVDPAIDSAYQCSSKVSEITDHVVLTAKHTSELVKSLEVLKRVSQGLAFVPIVGPIAQKIPDIIKPVEKVTKGLKEILDKAQSSLKKMNTTVKSSHEVLGEVQHQIHLGSENFINYANSLGIVSDVFMILNSFSEISKQTYIKDKMDKLLSSLNNEVEAIVGQLNEVTHLFNDFDSFVSQIEKQVEEKFNPLLSRIKNIVKVFNTIGQILNPIANAFNKIINAIAPLKWLLNAVSWLFNKILKPIIDKILDLLGVNELIRKLEEKIKEDLGINQLENMVNEMEKKLSKILLEDLITEVEKIEKSMNQVLKKTQNFVSLVSCETEVKKVLKDMYDDFSESELPPWSFDENFIFEIDKMKLRESEYIPFSHHRRNKLPATPTTLLTKMEVDDLLLVNADESEEMMTLKNDILTSKNSLDSLVDTFNQQINKYNRLNNLVMNIETHTLEIYQYKSFLDTLEKYIALLESVEVLKGFSNVLELIKKTVETQKTGIEQLKDNINSTRISFGTLLEEVHKVYMGLPLQQDIDTTYLNLYNSLTSLTATTKMLDECDVYAKEGSKLAKLNNQKQAVRNNVSTVSSILRQFDSNMQYLKEIGMTFVDKTDEIEKYVNELSDEENHLINSKLFQNIATVCSNIDSLNSMLEPLKHVIEFIEEKGKEKTNIVSEMFLKYLKKFDGFVECLAQSEVIDELINSVLPIKSVDEYTKVLIEKIKSSLAFVCQDLSCTTVYFEEASKSLLCNKSYMLEIGDVEEKVDNLYVDDEFISDITEILSEEGIPS